MYQSRSYVANEVINLAMDPLCRKELLDNPIETIKSKLGIDLAKNVKLNIVEEGDKDFTIVLPPLVEEREPNW